MDNVELLRTIGKICKESSTCGACKLGRAVEVGTPACIAHQCHIGEYADQVVEVCEKRQEEGDLTYTKYMMALFPHLKTDMVTTLYCVKDFFGKDCVGECCDTVDLGCEACWNMKVQPGATVQIAGVEFPGGVA